MTIVGDAEVRLEERIRVLGPIERGSVVVVPDSTFAREEGESEEAHADRVTDVLRTLENAAGHAQFAVVSLDPDERPIGVLGRDAAKAILRELLAEIAEEDRGTA